MKESIREEGKWWAPATPEQVSAGTLLVDDEGARLESVVGPLANVNIADPQIFHSGPPVLNGLTHAGVTYTLFRNFYSGFRKSVDTVATLDVVHLLRGRHFENQAAATFREGVFQYSNLHLWLFELDPLKVEPVPGQQRTFKVSHIRSDLWRADLGDGFVLRNTYSFQRGSSVNPASATFSHTDGIYLTAETERAYTDFLPCEYRFRALVNLLGNCQLEVCSEVFRLDPGSDVQLIGRHSCGGFTRRDDPRRNQTPVRFASLENFSAVVEGWFAEYSRLKPIVDLYFFGKHNRTLDTGTVFLGVIQALEAYHRTYCPGAFMAQAEYNAKVRPLLDAAIPDGLDGPFRQRLRSAIQYGFEFSLRRRLSELVASLPESDVFATVRQSEFRNRTVDTRNTMTHQIAAPEFPPLQGAELYAAVQRWREVLFALILARIGVGGTVVLAAVERLRRSAGTFVTL
jgi:hypothetical protein